MVETEKSRSSSRFTQSHPEIPAYRMESTGGTEHVEGSRGFCSGAGNITMAKAFKIIMMDQEILSMRGLCASRRIRFATQFGKPVVMPRDEGLQGEEENVFLDRLPVLSSITSRIATITSTLRHRAQHGLRGDRVGEAEHPGPMVGARVRSLSADAEMVSWQERPVHACEPFSHSQRVS